MRRNVDLSINRPLLCSLPAQKNPQKNYCTSTTLTFTRVADRLEKKLNNNNKMNLSIFHVDFFQISVEGVEEKINPREATHALVDHKKQQ